MNEVTPELSQLKACYESEITDDCVCARGHVHMCECQLVCVYVCLLDL